MVTRPVMNLPFMVREVRTLQLLLTTSENTEHLQLVEDFEDLVDVNADSRGLKHLPANVLIASSADRRDTFV